MGVRNVGVCEKWVCDVSKHGDRLVGYKLGNIAKVMQDAFGLDQPDYGFLLGSTFVYEGTTLSLKDYIKPYVELEPAFVLKGPLKGPNVTVADVINAIDYAIPAIEIIDSRVKNWAIDLPDTLADNGSTAAVILGGTPRRLTELNLSNTRGVLRFNDQEVMTGNTRNILGNPISAVAWLVNKLSKYDVEFSAGQVILPGSCLQAVPMQQTGHWSCTFEGFGTIEFDVGA
ncbi:2-oxopent-4-enoate hydratase [Colletotrichum truncatum]|uniref:2-oxopent-4-enoate hydratase n=1 Tax=Colletotrichum truncatum TaxID=5467 RepID=A0ACC3YVK0_COLTU|nr:2-oxopent-4-enoate hydratase [Colletotrichum truncatum]KAF6791325.1 2-oxopent-4-enoate hydratase [Colletotrichum truncatum]